MKYQSLYRIGERVLYNSLSNAGAAHGVIIEVNNDKKPHTYKIESDRFRSDERAIDTVEEKEILHKIS